MMEQREKLIELLKNEPISLNQIAEKRADYLLANGVVVLPCRCEECVYSLPTDDGAYKCTHPQWSDSIFGVYKDDFCSYGERKWMR